MGDHFASKVDGAEEVGVEGAAPVDQDVALENDADIGLGPAKRVERLLSTFAVGVVPRAKVIELATNFLAPVASRVGRQGVSGIGLGRFGRRGRMTFGHGDIS